MTLDRRTMLSICLGSAMIMAGSGFMMWSRWEKLKTAAPAAPPKSIPDTFDPSLSAGTGWPSAPVSPQTPAPAPPAAQPASPAAAPNAGPRNIRFSYRNSRPKKVELVGSFNKWSPVPMEKGENFVWSVSVSLPVGEHSYNFLVDGKPVRDPNNPRTAPEGRSLLVVKPLQ